MYDPLRHRELTRVNLHGNFRHYEYLTDYKQLTINSYEDFLQANIPHDERKNVGFKQLLDMYFPIYQPKSGVTIYCEDYKIVPSGYSKREDQLRNGTHSSTLHLKIGIKLSDSEEINSQWVVAGDIPRLTADATFVINGHERIPVMELVKCPGVVFIREQDTHAKSHYINIAKIYPSVGAWLHFKLDRKSISVSIDKKTKLSIVTLLKCFPKIEGVNTYENDAEVNANSYSIDEILSKFYNKVKINLKNGKAYYTIQMSKYKFIGVPHDIYDLNGNKLYAKGSKILDRKGPMDICCPIEDIGSLYIAQNIRIGNFTAYVSRPVSEIKIDELKTLSDIIVYEYNDDNLPYILNDFASEFSSRHDSVGIHSYNSEFNRDQALKNLARHLRISAYHNVISLAGIFERKFFDRKYYDLMPVGRFQLNISLGINKTELFLTMDDIVHTLKNLMEMATENRESDDIDSLRKKIVYTCADYMREYLRANLNKFRDTVIDRTCNLTNIKTIATSMNFPIITHSLVNNLVNHCHLYNDLNYVSTISQHSKIDSGNGLRANERVSSAQRDINPTYLGRICPIQTSEGKKVGITSYLAIFSRINEHGFIITPYHPVINGEVQKEIIYLTAHEDEDKIIGDISMYDIKNGKLVPNKEYILGLHRGEVIDAHYQDIDLVMISNNQMNSIAISLVPRSETNDTYRTMVGGNMASQAMPILHAEAPMVSTGMDAKVSHKIRSPATGKVVRVDMNRIIISDENGDLYKVELAIHKKTNSNTSCTYRPLVNLGDEVTKGELIADGFTTRKGELAIGHNVLVMFSSHMYTYEDSAIVSEDLIQQNLFSSPRRSMHICNVQDTRLGTEQLTKNIPGASVLETRHLDESGIVKIGSRVNAGDILVGKITPQLSKSDAGVGDTKLIKMLLSDFDNNYKDTSLRVPPATSGTVISVEVLTSKHATKDDRTLTYDKIRMQEIEHSTEEQIKLLANNYLPKFTSVLKKRMTTAQITSALNAFKIKDIEKKFGEHVAAEDVKPIYDAFIKQRRIIEASHDEKASDVNSFYETPEGYLKIVRVYLMEDHVISVGDKIAGRCGNKAVISKVMPKVDMPYLPDGTSVDIVLSSLGIVARMNNGQLYEAFIGYAIYELRKKIGRILRELKYNQYTIQSIRPQLNELIDYATGAFGNENVKKASSYDDESILKLANMFYEEGIYISIEQYVNLPVKEFEKLLHKLGCMNMKKTYVYDGKTGERSFTPVTVGYVYIMALHHTADSKIHARSTGQISSMSMQPVYGRSRNGGQRFGEMEGWAEQGKGCAYILQEMLNAKSDALNQKSAIVKQIISSGSASLSACYNELSEGFRNLACYLMACGIEIQILDNDGNVVPEWFHANLDQPHLSDIKARITILPVERVEQISKGEVKNTETHHFKSFEPIKDGLCDMAIFGPTNDYVCKCGELKGRRYEGLRCPKCNVLIASSLVRREHFGHIELATKIVHPLFIRSNDNKIAYLLGLPGKTVNDIVSLEAYVITGSSEITKPDGSLYKAGDIISSEEYDRINRVMILERIVDLEFEALTGGKAIEYLIDNFNMLERITTLSQQLSKVTSRDARMDIAENLIFLKTIVDRKIPIKGLVLSKLLICPANLRPIVELSPGNFASSDLNYLYKTIKLRNMNMKGCQESEVFVEIMHKYQEKLLFESINNCIGANGTSVTNLYKTSSRQYKSILEMISGKEGLLRRTLLGKRVDFSGRAVIVTAPTTKLDECFIPEEMAIELFKPHIMHELVKGGIAMSIKIASEIIRLRKPIIFTALERILSRSLVYLNRAPTLHRVGIMAFRPRLWQHNTIGLNPLTCLAYNADFDGDQMAVHVPLTNEAIAEAYYLSRPSVNIGSVAHGGFMVAAFKDMMYGIYALTSTRKAYENIKPPIFYSVQDAEMAWQTGSIAIVQIIQVYYENKMITTTVGRLKFMAIIPSQVHKKLNLNKTIEKKDIQVIMNTIRNTLGDAAVVEFINHVQNIGFEYATYFAASFGLEDFMESAEIKNIIKNAQEKRISYFKQLKSGFISSREFYKKCMDLSNDVTARQDKAIHVLCEANPDNPIVQIPTSGARATKANLRQIFASKGNPVGINGKISPIMVFNNTTEGMSQLEYYALTPGARKGCRDTALSTADAGYLTRKLVDLAHSCIINGVDCKTTECILARNTYYEGKLLYTVYDQVLGRTLAKPIVIDKHKTFVVGTLLRHGEIEILQKNDIQEIYIFSPALCNMVDGVCVKCYGADLSKMKPAQCGDSVGTIAAQSMGEPSTQLVMRSFHSGGVSSMSLTANKIVTPAVGKLSFNNLNYVTTENNRIINISRNTTATITNRHGHAIANITIPYGAEITSLQDTMIEAGHTIATTQTEMPFIAHYTGTIVMDKMFEGINCETIIDDKQNKCLVVKAHTVTPIIQIVNNNEVLQQIYVPEDTLVIVSDHAQVKVGDMIGYVRKTDTSNTDITTVGLQYISNILENRIPMNVATIAPVSGTIKFKQTSKKNVIVIITDNGEEVLLPRMDISNTLYTHDNRVEKGDIISTGIPIMQDILDYQGVNTLIDYFVIGLQSMYLSNGLNVNNKHFEVILSQMIRMYMINEGEYIGHVMHKSEICEEFMSHIPKTLSEPKVQAWFDKNTIRIVKGITDGALNARSFLSKISFQTTIKGIVGNALKASVDPLTCAKSCAISGKLGAFGTGYVYREIMASISKEVPSDSTEISYKC